MVSLLLQILGQRPSWTGQPGLQADWLRAGWRLRQAHCTRFVLDVFKAAFETSEALCKLPSCREVKVLW